jgi:hypothetical protein
VEAEGQQALPGSSSIEWQGLGQDCQTINGHKGLSPHGPTVVSLPICEVRLTVLVPGFTTQAATVDLAKGRDKLGKPIEVTLKRHGPMKLEW